MCVCVCVCVCATQKKAKQATRTPTDCDNEDKPEETTLTTGPLLDWAIDCAKTLPRRPKKGRSIAGPDGIFPLEFPLNMGECVSDSPEIFTGLCTDCVRVSWQESGLHQSKCRRTHSCGALQIPNSGQRLTTGCSLVSGE